MGSQKNTSMVLDNLGNLSAVAGSITVGLGASAALTCNDPSTTLATAATGVFTLTFGQAFLSTPIVTVTPYTAGATDTLYAAFVSSVSTTGAVINYRSLAHTASTATTIAVATTTGAATTDIIHFTAIGLRNR